uniref:Uncharacterized protein n=1 Tax=Burkholderia sp. JS667 TaxID=622617 RepID=C3UVB5_9BURK|nr:hypothetical protein [Burkholderia sp. JS667]
MPLLRPRRPAPRSAADAPRHDCKACRSTFNARAETPLARLQHKKKMVQATRAPDHTQPGYKTVRLTWSWGGLDGGTGFFLWFKANAMPCTELRRRRHAYPGSIQGQEVSAMQRQARKRGGKPVNPEDL